MRHLSYGIYIFSDYIVISMSRNDYKGAISKAVSGSGKWRGKKPYIDIAEKTKAEAMDGFKKGFVE